MNAKERQRAVKLLDELRALVALDERRQSTRGGGANHHGAPNPNTTPERMAELRKMAMANRRKAREAKLWAELMKLQEGPAPDDTGAGK